MAFLLFLVPFVNVLMIFLIIFQMAKVFGKGFLFGLGLLFLPVIFFPVLAFGDSRYIGP